ncbi:MAG: type II secretion system F family protein [Candidatus Bathyarchaeia archaeon]
MEKISEVFRSQKKLKPAAFGASAGAGVLLVASGYLLFYPRAAFHLFISLGIVAACAAPALIYHFEGRKKRMIDDMLPRLLEDVAESQEAGMTLLQALEESSNRKYGPITEELKTLVTQLSWGVGFDEAFNAFGARIGTELSVRVTTLLLEAIELGGDIKTTFKSTADFVRKMIALRDEREGQLKQYMMVIYVSSLVFMLILIILYQSFFLSMASGSQDGFGGTGEISLEEFKTILFDLAIVEAFFGGLIVAKLSQRVTLTGLKHTVILLGAVSLIFGLVFIDISPPSVGEVYVKPEIPRSTAPVTIMAEISDWGSGIKNATIYYTTDNWKTNSTSEMIYNPTNELWEGYMPPQPTGTWVYYYIVAYDNSDNIVMADNGGTYYKYNVGP